MVGKERELKIWIEENRVPVGISKVDELFQQVIHCVRVFVCSVEAFWGEYTAGVAVGECEVHERKET